jgi:glycosyltransferase involved in cell wall biosynthesis
MIPSKIFTIIIPCKNEESYIYNTLKSISSQIYLEWCRVIIADANSTDGTINEIHRAIEDFKNLKIEIIKGGMVSYGRNQGAKLANTPYLIFMDADSVLLDRDILLKTYNTIQYKLYKLITVKQKSTTDDIVDNLIWKSFNIIRNLLPESFSTGCFFVIKKSVFDYLGGFDETVTQSEDFILSRQIPKNYFKILNRYVGQDNRRFKKMGYLNFIKLVMLNYWNKNNIKWFSKDVGYWNEK